MQKILNYLFNDPRFLGFDSFGRVSVEFRFAPWITLFLAIAAVFLAIYAYRQATNLSSTKRRILTTLRASAYIALLFILAGPKLRFEGEGGQSGPIPVVLDRTESMTIEDMNGKSRFFCASALRNSLIANSGEEKTLRQIQYLYGNGVESYETYVEKINRPKRDAKMKEDKDPEIKIFGGKTSLKAMITESLKEHRGAYCPGLLLISDAANNVPDLIDPAIEDMKKRKIPLYIAAIGQENPKDVSIDYIVGEEIVFLNEKTKFYLNVTQNGYAKKSFKPIVTFGATPVDVPETIPEKDGDFSIPVEFKPDKEGVFDFVAEITPDKDESTTQNNKLAKRVRVIKDRIRVLIISGYPSWEYRFLTGAFQRDRRVEYKTFLQNIDPRVFKYEQTNLISKLPKTNKELFSSFDIILLTKIDIGLLPPDFNKMMMDFVSQEGGGMIVLSDDDYIPFGFAGTELEQMLPVKMTASKGKSNLSQEMFKPLDTPYQLELTEDGAGNPLVTFDGDIAKNKLTWMSLPPLYEMVTDVELKPSAIPIVTASVAGGAPGAKKYPAITYQNFGKGTVLYMGFDTTWRWRKIYGDRYFRDYWGKAVQFLGLPHLLGESAPARIFLDTANANVGDRIIVNGSIRNRDYTPYITESVQATVKDKDNVEASILLIGSKDRPGIFRANFYPEKEGKYTFSLPNDFSAEPAELIVTKVSREYKNAGIKAGNLKSLTDMTGGDLFLLSSFTKESTNAPAKDGLSAKEKIIQTDRQNRVNEIIRLKAKIEKSNQNVFESKEFLDKYSIHIIKSIAENRPRLPLLIEKDLWDYLGTMLLAAILLCCEYVLRKLWYLD